MLWTIVSFFAAAIVGGFYLNSHDPDGATKCDQACVADSSEEP
jgi:hypothetical protein